MKKFLMITAISALGATGAMANDLDKLDTDGDGLLSLEEVQAEKPEVTEGEFNSYDADGDSFLNEDEFTAWKDAKKSEDGGMKDDSTTDEEGDSGY